MTNVSFNSITKMDLLTLIILNKSNLNHKYLISPFSFLISKNIDPADCDGFIILSPSSSDELSLSLPSLASRCLLN